MRKLQRYILKDTFKALIPAFLTLVSIMAVGLCLQLLHDGLDVVRLYALLPPLLTYCVPMVLPSAFLTAVIMTFGRLSADNELLAIRAAGINPIRVIYPVVAVAMLLSVVAAFLQFETVPRARGKLKALKYKALQQILLDQVALSARRQFSFNAESGPILIKYRDFRDGRMIGLLAIMVQNQRVRNVIRAATCTIRPDPARPESDVLFEMADCVVTQFGGGQDGQPVTMTAAAGRIGVAVAEPPEEVYAQQRHLGAAALLARLRRLHKSVREQPTRFDDPNQVHDQLRSAWAQKRNEVADLDRALEAVRRDYEEYAVEKPDRQEQVLKAARERMAELEASLEGLREQQKAVHKEIRELGLEGADYDRLEALQKTSAARDGQIEAAKNETQELTKKAAAARALKDSYAERAEERKKRVEELEKVSDELQAEKRALGTQIRWADDQEELRKIRLRIHKRLAQALSVLVFALLGIPIGVLAGGRSVMMAFGISFAIVLVLFYPLLILGQIAAEAGAVPILPAIWAGNSLTFIIGLALMVKVMHR